MQDTNLIEAESRFRRGEYDKGLGFLKAACAGSQVQQQTIVDAANLLQSTLCAMDFAGPIADEALPALPPQPLITVVIATRDRAKLLGDALASLAQQDYPAWEAVVVNDGGESVSPVVAAASLASRIRLINFEHSKGQAAARNAGIADAGGAILCFLDDDDRYLPGHLASLEQMLQKNAVAYTGCEVVRERLAGNRRVDLMRFAQGMPPQFSRSVLRVRNYIPMNCMAVRSACLAQMGGFDEGLEWVEDWDLLQRLAARWHFAHTAKATAEYRMRESHVKDSVSSQAINTVHLLKRLYAKHPADDSAMVRYARELHLKLGEYRAPRAEGSR